MLASQKPVSGDIEDDLLPWPNHGGGSRLSGEFAAAGLVSAIAASPERFYDLGIFCAQHRLKVSAHLRHPSHCGFWIVPSK